MRIYKFILPLLVLLVVFTHSAWAISLDSAKAQGLIGERPNGYLGTVNSSPSADVQMLVTEINSKREAKYREIAKKNGSQLSQVEALAGKTAIEKTSPGQYVQLPSGTWRIK